VALDRVQPLKLEDTATGGDEIDAYPTAVDKNEDFIDCRGIALQSDTSNDEQAILSRDGSGNMTFTDVVTGAVFTLSMLISGGFDVNNVIFDNAGGLVYDNTELVVTR
jgi:hypothetical protein